MLVVIYHIHVVTLYECVCSGKFCVIYCIRIQMHSTIFHDHSFAKMCRLKISIIAIDKPAGRCATIYMCDTMCMSYTCSIVYHISSACM